MCVSKEALLWPLPLSLSDAMPPLPIDLSFSSGTNMGVADRRDSNRQLVALLPLFPHLERAGEEAVIARRRKKSHLGGSLYTHRERERVVAQPTMARLFGCPAMPSPDASSTPCATYSAVSTN